MWAYSHRVALVLSGVILIFVILSGAIAIRTPAYEFADEPGHVENIESLVAGHWYGINSSCRSTAHGFVDCAGIEAHQAPLYYLLLAGWQRLAGQAGQATYHGQPNIKALSGSPELFLHPSAADHRFLLWLRLPNVLLGAITVLLTFYAIRLITANVWTPVLAASIVAFLPEMDFLSASVTNDNLATLLGVLLTFVALRCARRPSRLRIATVGLVFGLLVATKLSALPLGIVLIVLPVTQVGWRRRAEYLGIGAAGALVTCGWYLLQNTVRYGDPLARRASSHYLQVIGGLGTFAGLPYVINNPLKLVVVQVPQRVFTHFWFATAAQWWPLWISLLFWVVLAASFAGLVGRRVPRTAPVPLVCIALAALMSVWIVAFQTESYEPRYALTGIAAIAGLAALGSERWIFPARFLLPVMGLVGTIVTIQHDVFAVHWT